MASGPSEANFQHSTFNIQLPPKALLDLERNEQLLSALSMILTKMKRQRGRITLNGMLNLFELSSLLGRRACGPPEDPQERIRLQQIEAALLKVYGPKELP